VTAIGPVHLERMKRLEVIEGAKFEITERANGRRRQRRRRAVLARWPATARRPPSACARPDRRTKRRRCACAPTANEWVVQRRRRVTVGTTAIVSVQPTNLACALAGALELGVARPATGVERIATRDVAVARTDRTSRRRPRASSSSTTPSTPIPRVPRRRSHSCRRTRAHRSTRRRHAGAGRTRPRRQYGENLELARKVASASARTRDRRSHQRRGPEGRLRRDRCAIQHARRRGGVGSRGAASGRRRVVPQRSARPLPLMLDDGGDEERGDHWRALRGSDARTRHLDPHGAAGPARTERGPATPTASTGPRPDRSSTRAGDVEAEAFLEGVPRGSSELTLRVGDGGGFFIVGRRERQLELDAVLLATHGGPGEDGSLQATLDLAGVAYSGPSAAGAALGMDKWAFGAVMGLSGLPDAAARAANERDDVAGLRRPLHPEAPFWRFVDRHRRRGGPGDGEGPPRCERPHGARLHRRTVSR
jgi:hypothetical protein